MSTFEYLAIAFSLVYSFGAMRIVEGLPAAIQVERRYWVHLTFMFLHLLLIVISFWAVLSLRDASWTLPKFGLTLAMPALFFYSACTLVPNDPSAVESWRDYYYSIRQRFWIANMMIVITATSIATVMLGVPWDHPGRVPHGFGLIAATIGAVADNERVHSALAVVALTLVIVLSIVAIQPGYFAK